MLAAAALLVWSVSPATARTAVLQTAQEQEEQEQQQEGQEETTEQEGEEAEAESDEETIEKIEKALDAADPEALEEAVEGHVGLADKMVDDYIEKAVEAELAGRPDEAASYWYRAESLGQVTSELGAGQGILVRIQQAKQWERPQQQAFVEARDFERKGLEALGADDLEGALDEYDRAEEIYDRLAYGHGSANVARMQGETLGRLGRQAEAAERLVHAVDLYERLDDINGLAESTASLGQVYAALGRLDEAAAQLRRATQLADRISDRVLLSRNLSRYGSLMSQLGNHVEAVEAFERSLEISQLAGREVDQALDLRNLAESYMELGRYKEAMDAARLSMNMVQRFDFQQLLDQALGGNGLLRRVSDVLGIRDSFGLMRSLDSLQREILKRMAGTAP